MLPELLLPHVVRCAPPVSECSVSQKHAKIIEPETLIVAWAMQPIIHLIRTLPPPLIPVSSWKDWWEHCLCSWSLQHHSKGHKVPFDVSESLCHGLSCNHLAWPISVASLWCQEYGPQAGSKPLLRESVLNVYMAQITMSLYVFLKFSIYSIYTCIYIYKIFLSLLYSFCFMR